MRREAGSTLVELTAVLALIGLGVGMATWRADGDGSVLAAETERVEGAINGARARALFSSDAVRLVATDSATLQAATAPECNSGTWSPLPDEGLVVSGVTLTATGPLCWSGSGFPADDWNIRVTHAVEGAREIDVMLGGGMVMTP